MQGWLCKASEVDGLHSQSAQAVAGQFFGALKAWEENKEAEGSKLPNKQKKYNKVIFKSSALKLKNNTLFLLRGRNTKPIKVDWPHNNKPKRVELRYNESVGEHELCCQYKKEPNDRTSGNKTAGVDLGEIHLATVHDGDETLLFNGKEFRSKRN